MLSSFFYRWLFTGILPGLFLATLVLHEAAAQELVLENTTPAVLIATAQVNIRASATVTSKKIGVAHKGERLTMRQHEGRWYRIDDPTHPHHTGFIYARYLMPIINGILENPVSARTRLQNGTDCAYDIYWVNIAPMPSVLWSTADYEASVQCHDKTGRGFSFPIYLFFTEAPFQAGRDQPHQLGVDLFNVVDGREEERVLSASIFYHPTKKVLSFDSLSDNAFLKNKPDDKEAVDTIRQILGTALEMTLNSWKNSVWVAIKEANE